VCPHAKLYVARLDEYKTSAGKRHITASSAAEVRLIENSLTLLREIANT
jgi:Subtilase family